MAASLIQIIGATLVVAAAATVSFGLALLVAGVAMLVGGVILELPARPSKGDADGPRPPAA